MCLVRPAIGYIAEGDGERASFPSLIYRLCDTLVKPIHILKVHGNGDITANLEEKLTDLAETHAPITILVCLDLVDALKSNSQFSSCRELLENLQNRANDWTSSGRIERNNLPQEITFIAVIPKFESWYFADLDAIRRTCLVDLCSINLPNNINNVDVDIKHPKHIIKILYPNTNINKPYFAKNILSKSNLTEMKRKSRSFKKFADETEKATSRHHVYLESTFGC